MKWCCLLPALSLVPISCRHVDPPPAATSPPEASAPPSTPLKIPDARAVLGEEFFKSAQVVQLREWKVYGRTVAATPDRISPQTIVASGPLCVYAGDKLVAFGPTAASRLRITNAQSDDPGLDFSGGAYLNFGFPLSIGTAQ